MAGFASEILVGSETALTQFLHDGYGKKQLEKYGWKTGDGMGKDRRGQKSHIRVKKKSNTLGVRPLPVRLCVTLTDFG
jgi:hypothetical protein